MLHAPLARFTAQPALPGWSRICACASPPFQPAWFARLSHPGLQFPALKLATFSGDLYDGSFYDPVQVLNAELFFFHCGPETEPGQRPFQFGLIAANEIFRSGIILKTKGFRTVQRIDQQNILRKFH